MYTRLNHTPKRHSETLYYFYYKIVQLIPEYSAIVSPKIYKYLK